MMALVALSSGTVSGAFLLPLLYLSLSPSPPLSLFLLPSFISHFPPYSHHTSISLLLSTFQSSQLCL